MHGLVSLLDKNHYALVEEIWQELETDCGLKGIHVTPLPHFSWQIAEDYEWTALETALQDMALIAQPFPVYTTGLAFFTGERPVAYIPVVRTGELSIFHEMIWKRITPLSTRPSLYYSPSFWMPHISLAYGDLDTEKLSCLMDKLAFRTFNWQIEIDNLTLIYEPEGTIGQARYQFSFGEKEL
jgi:2'-5' RNA ligase